MKKFAKNIINDIQKLNFKIKNKWHPKTKKTVHHNVVTSDECYIDYNYHIRLTYTTQVRLRLHLHPKP